MDGALRQLHLFREPTRKKCRLFQKLDDVLGYNRASFFREELCPEAMSVKTTLIQTVVYQLSSSLSLIFV